ncbi:MAG: hypothetical protein HYZ42_01125, partial [Bacteroidetes bacterium]|nr:hypothetical protein [Bacteroidota bacterium]
MKQYIHRLEFLCLFYFLHIQEPGNAQSINEIGNLNEFNQASYNGADYSDITTDSAGNIYIVFRESASFVKTATVRMFNGSQWSLIGNGNFSDGDISDPRIAIDRSGNIYVVYIDDANSNKATVMQYHGGTWSTVGSTGFSQSGVRWPSIAIDRNGIPYVVYQDQGTSSKKATVKKFINGSWSTVGSANFSAGEVRYTDIAIDSNNVPYVVYRDGGNSNRCTVKKFTGGSWNTVGSVGFSSAPVNYTSIAIHNTTPYVIYQDGANNGKATVKKINGNSWSTLGSAGFSSGDVAATSIEIDNSGIVYACYSLTVQSHFGKAEVMRYANNTWSPAGSGDISVIGANAPYITLNKAGNPYIVYSDYSIGGKATVMGLVGGTWTRVGPISGIGRGSASNLSAKIFNNDLYILYADGADSNRITFQKFDGNNWIVLGSRPNPPTEVNLFATFDMDKNGVPYIAYRQTDKNYEPVVKSLNNGSWSSLGDSITSNRVGYTDVSLDSSGVVYIAYTDSLYGYRISVKKYINGTWTLVGSNGLTAGQANNISLLFDKNNVPYIVYQDVPNSFRISVIKYINSNWVNVGSAGFSTADALDPKLTFNQNNVPHVVFRDKYRGYNATLMSFNGTGWDSLGYQGFTSEKVGAMDINFDHYDSLFIFYEDSFKANIKKFSNGTWKNIASDFCAGRFNDASILFDDENNPTVVYANSQAFARKFSSVLPDSNVLYVDSSIAFSGDGFSWLHAYKTIQEALRFAESHSYIDTIRVAKGTYHPDNQRDSAFILVNGTVLEGGYPSGGGIRNVIANPTIMDGNAGSVGKVYHVVLALAVDSTTVLDGFTITNGKADFFMGPKIRDQIVLREAGGGVFIGNRDYFNSGKRCNPTILNCRFINDSASSYGGAVFLWGSDSSYNRPTFYNCFFDGNYSWLGGAIYNDATGNNSPYIIDCIFQNNIATLEGGAIYNTGSNKIAPPLIQNCIIKNNNGGAIFNYFSAPRINNCYFESNHSKGEGGAISYVCTDSFKIYPEILNCVFINNTSDIAGGGGAINIRAETTPIYNNGPTIINPLIFNCIFLNNIADGSGGAILYSGDSLSVIKPLLLNCSFYGNKATIGQSIYGQNSSFINSDTCFINNSII